jgi:hypothetical protein
MMRKRTDVINVRVYQTEKNLIRRKAKKCGMNLSEYLRTLGTEAAVQTAPSESLRQAYQKLLLLHDRIRGDPSMVEWSRSFSELETLLLSAYHGREASIHGGDEDLGDP